MAANWSNPTTSSTYANHLDDLKNRDLSAVKLDPSGDSNIPTGAVYLNTTTKRLTTYNGASYDDALSDYTSHLTNTSNPHSVTHTQVGSATAQWNASKLQGVDVSSDSPDDTDILAYQSSSTSWKPLTASDLGLATSATVSAHTSNTSNPHSVTATQVGACATANNLSDVANAATALTNLGGATSATVSSHTSNTSNPHSVTRAQISAAKDAANSDITSLDAATSIGPGSGDITYKAGGGASDEHLFQHGGSTRYVMNKDYLRPSVTNAIDFGTSSYRYKDIYLAGKLKHATATGSWSFFSYTTMPSLNPAAATTVNNADAINTIFKIMENFGMVN